MPTARKTATPAYRVRRSPIHGTGVFAAREIRKGERLMEYVGERVSHAEADRRYEDKAADDNHTFLFTVDSRTVIDAGVGGNEARWVNHSCDPNCETVIEDKRVYVEAIRPIAPGAELTYDYMIGREPGDPPNIDEIFACRCGSAICRGTMLLPPKKPRRKPAKKGANGGKGKAAAKGGRVERHAHAETAARRRVSKGKSAAGARGKTAAHGARGKTAAPGKRGRTSAARRR